MQVLLRLLVRALFIQNFFQKRNFVLDVRKGPNHYRCLRHLHNRLQQDFCVKYIVWLLGPLAFDTGPIVTAQIQPGYNCQNYWNRDEENDVDYQQSRLWVHDDFKPFLLFFELFQSLSPAFLLPKNVGPIVESYISSPLYPKGILG